MKKEHALIIKKAVRENANDDWFADKDGNIYWDYISIDKPAFEVFIGSEHKDEDGTSTRVFVTDLTLNETCGFVYAGTDRLLCDCYTIEEAIYIAVRKAIRKAMNTY